MAPIILGGFAVLAATFVGVRWVQFKQRRNQKKLPTQHKRIVDARVAGLLEKGRVDLLYCVCCPFPVAHMKFNTGGDVSGLLSISKVSSFILAWAMQRSVLNHLFVQDLAPADGQNEQDFAKLGSKSFCLTAFSKRSDAFATDTATSPTLGTYSKKRGFPETVRFRFKLSFPSLS